VKSIMRTSNPEAHKPAVPIPVGGAGYQSHFATTDDVKAAAVDHLVHRPHLFGGQAHPTVACNFNYILYCAYTLNVYSITRQG
jgi:hypothetical protein